MWCDFHIGSGPLGEPDAKIRPTAQADTCFPANRHRQHLKNGESFSIYSYWYLSLDSMRAKRVKTQRTQSRNTHTLLSLTFSLRPIFQRQKCCSLALFRIHHIRNRIGFIYSVFSIFRFSTSSYCHKHTYSHTHKHRRFIRGIQIIYILSLLLLHATIVSWPYFSKLLPL